MFENVKDKFISFGRLGEPVSDIWQTSNKGTHQKAFYRARLFTKPFSEKSKKALFRARFFRKVFSEKNKKPSLERDFSQNHFPKKVKSVL